MSGSNDMRQLHDDLARCLHRVDELNLEMIGIPLSQALSLLREHMAEHGFEVPPRPATLWSADDEPDDDWCEDASERAS